MIKSRLHIITLAALLAFTVQSAYAEKSTFTSAEHTEIGNQINLQFNANEPGQVGQPIPLPNGLQLTYGEILTLVDFFEVVEQPISKAHTEAERRARFLAAFSTLSLQEGALTEVPKLLELFRSERKLIDDAIAEGKSTDEMYQSLGHQYDIQFNCITGGGCTEATWLIDQGRYLKLANEDYDHFGKHALQAYITGHQLAMEQAAAAHVTHDQTKLQMAYAMNAFASHFLTDRFSTGHIRTPRLELTEHTTPGTVGSLLSNYMHGEENRYGLHVYNKRGDHWIAYGDKTYFKPETAKHRKIIHDAVQASADDIYATYLSGHVSASDDVDSLLPIPDEVERDNINDISPMFYWDETTNQLYRRTHLSRPYDREWTTSWWGWSTLLELQRERGMTDTLQAKLAQSPLREQAVRDGLITEPSLKAYVMKTSRLHS